jgi:hypothetical protein
MTHVAQLNIARVTAPLDSPEMKDFMNGLDPINHLADRSPGFVWRLVGPDAALGATDLRGPFGDDVLVNMSVWETVEALRAFTYHSEHLEYLRRRREFFHHDGIATHLVLWNVPEGHIPTLDEAAAHLDHLTAHGPTRHAFTLREPFD